MTVNSIFLGHLGQNTSGVLVMPESMCCGIYLIMFLVLTGFPYASIRCSLPIPEGLAPLTAAHLDSHLTDLINRYTLQGVPILVHCRGGVGRAGVIACCWIMKLGLCGWIDEVQRPSKPQTGTEGTSIITEETLHFIEKVIMLVRRRRSVKAVETYEQVKFLVDFVEFLRQRSKSEE
jgi:hypothetical protein